MPDEIDYEYSEKVSNTDYVRVLREYADQVASDLDRRRGLRHQPRGTPGRRRLPRRRVPDGRPLRAARGELLRVRQLHPRALLPDGHDRRLDDRDEPHRHGRRLPHRRGQPPLPRLHGRGEARSIPRSSSRSPSSALGTTRRRPRRRPSPRSRPAPTSCTPSARASSTPPARRACSPSATSTT